MISTLLALLGCAEKQTPNPTASTDDVRHTQWVLLSAQDASNKALIDVAFLKREPTKLSFDERQISIESPCNQLGMSYRANGHVLNVSRMISTRMACGASLMQVEYLLGRVLVGKVTVSRPTQTELRMQTASGVVLVWKKS